jgi:hypothetical protein
VRREDLQKDQEDQEGAAAEEMRRGRQGRGVRRDVGSDNGEYANRASGPISSLLIF